MMYRRLFEIVVVAALTFMVGIKIGKFRTTDRMPLVKADIIQTHRIQLTDGAGRVCGEFFVDKLGAPWLTLQDTRFPAMVSLTAGGRTNKARLVVTGGYRKTGAGLSSDSNTARLMMIAGERRGAVSWLDANSNGSTNLSLNAGAGNKSAASVEVNGVTVNGNGRPFGK